MQPKFINLPEMKIVGLGAKFISILSPNKNNSTVIPRLWEQFSPQARSIKNKTGNNFYGLVECLPESSVAANPGEMFYIAAVEVSNLDSIPAGMIHRVIPAGKYASFTHKGKLDRLEQTMNSIYNAWLPQSGLKLRNAPHLELYDHRFKPGSDQSEFDILLPVS